MDAYDLDNFDDYVLCPVCGGPASPMGALGNRHYFRCRNCGLDHSVLITPAAETEDSDGSEGT